MERPPGRRNGLFLAPLASILLLAILSVTVYLALHARWMDTLFANVESQRKDSLVQIVTVARNAVEPIMVQFRSGRIGRDEALEEIRSLVRRMTYSDQYGNNYVFMSSYDGTMLVQPFEPAKEMTSQWDLQDIHGLYIIRELVKAARTYPGGSFVRYWYHLPGVHEDQEKLAYVVGLPELSCYLGTGMYLQEAIEEQRGILEAVRSSSLWLIAGVLLPAGASVLLVLNRNRLLKAAEERYRSIFENTEEGVFQVSPEGRFLSVNPAMARMAGYGCPEAMLGDNLSAPEHYVNQEDRRRLYGIVEARGSVESFETPLRRPDGKVVWTSLNAHAVKDAAGRTLYIEGSLRDVTERRKTEEALRESEERLRAITANLPGVVYQFRAATDGAFTVTYVNEHIRGIFGLQEPPERLSPAFVAGIHEEDRERFRASIRKAVASCTPWSFEGRFRKGTGEILWFQGISTPTRHEDGIVFSGILLDITERRRAELASRQYEERLSKIYQSTPEFISITRLEDGRFIDVNRGFEEITGWSRRETVARTSLELGIWADPRERQAMVEELRAGRDVLLREYRFRRKDGAERIGVYSARPIAVDGEPCLIFVMQDITERRRQEEEKAKLQAQLLQSQKMESVGRLAGGVAHDFNNMLGVILGHAELALEGLGPEAPLRGDLEEILKAARRSSELTRQLLAFARRQTVTPQVLDLNDTISGMLRMLRRLIGEDIELSWAPGEGLWRVKIDPAQLDQVLANLFVNARDAIAGHGRIALETRNLSVDGPPGPFPEGLVPGDWVVLAVSDNGCGMDREVQEHLFEPFFTTKEVGKGTGLGLATIYGIVKQNDGFIHVYSEPGHGSTFRIYLPRAAGGAEPAQAPQAAGTWRAGGETVLLVEDEPAILAMGRTMLERLGCAVLTASTAEEAVRTAREHAGRIRLLITDVIMPGMNGRELAERIAALQPGLRLLYMSGYPADVISDHGVLEAGVRFIQKPFSFRGLGEKLREALEDG